jgi:hypothetical protein
VAKAPAPPPPPMVYSLHDKTVVLAHVMFLEKIQPTECRVTLHNGTTTMLHLQFASALACDEFFDGLTLALA